MARASGHAPYHSSHLAGLRLAAASLGDLQARAIVEKVRDIAVLFGAAGSCPDEKSQIQALDRSQPLLPMRPGHGAAHYDYKSCPRERS